MTGRRVAVRAPGRVNLVGEHTDYTGGLVLPMAIDLATIVEGTRGGDVVRLRSADEQQEAVIPVGIAAADVAALEPAWARYAAAVLVATGLRQGFDGEVRTTIPIGTGLSSSAALEVAVALALGADDDGRADRPALAEVLRRAEHLASGVPCGVMDQLASLCGSPGHAVLLDCSTLHLDLVALPEGCEVVIVDSGQRRALAGVPYAERRDETVRAAELLGGIGRAQHSSLADVDGIDDHLLRQRARHLVTENQRVLAVRDAFATGDLAAAGACLDESHASLRDDLEVTTPVLDELAARLSSSPGVHGARMTGGGWGGCVVALCEAGALPGVGWHVGAAAGASVALAPTSA